MSESASENHRAAGLIRIGEDGIARENDAALNAYFAEDFVFHSPDGNLDFPGLKAVFAALRAAFTDFQVLRPMILCQGDFVAARTTMVGVFSNPMQVAPFGIVKPTGQIVRRELNNIFRYNNDGRLAEEWVQYDNLSYLRQLGLELVPKER